MEILADFQNDNEDEDLMIAASQMATTSEISTRAVTNTVMTKKVNSPKKNVTTFTGCTFGSIGSINIHVHKH